MNLPLTDEEYKIIRHAYKKAKDTRTAEYLNIILLKHKGYKQIEIADILNIDENTVCTWIKKFINSQSLPEYLTLNYKAYIGKASFTILGKIDALVEEKSFTDVKPIISQVKSLFNIIYSVSGMSKLLKRLGFSYKEKVALPSKLNLEKQEIFALNYALLESQVTDKIAIYFMDAVHPQHNTHTLKAWLRRGKPSYTLTNNGRNRLNINGLYNPHNQDVIVTYHKTINAQATIETFEILKQQNPTHERLYVISDNAKYYVSRVLKAYLVENPIIKLIHLPSYSPNLNLIERLWKYTRKEIINPHYYEKFEDFSNAIKSFFDNIGQHKQALAQFIGNKFRFFNIEENPKTIFS
jgi:transposase